MDKKHTLIFGLEEGRVIAHPNEYFTNSEKHTIIEELFLTGSSKIKIWKKYTGQEKESGQLLRWMRKLDYDTSIKRRRGSFVLKTSIMASKNKKSKRKSVNETKKDDFENLQLKNRIVELEKKLRDSNMKAIAYATMVEIAEREFNIPIRKKYNTKPSKK